MSEAEDVGAAVGANGGSAVDAGATGEHSGSGMDNSGREEGNVRVFL